MAWRHWLSYFVLPSAAEDYLICFVFTLAPIGEGQMIDAHVRFFRFTLDTLDECE